MVGAGTDGLSVVLDIQTLQNPLHRDRGIGRYVRAHVDALLDTGARVVATVLNPDQPPPDTIPQRWRDAGLVRWNEPALARDLASEPFVYHVMSPFEPAQPEDGVVVRHMLEQAHALAVTLYDAIPYVFPEWYQRDDATRSFYRRRAELVRTADAVLAISEHTRRDAVDRLGVRPARVHHIGSGPSETSATELQATNAARLPGSVHKPYVLTVTGWGEPRKNPHSTFAAFAALPPDVRAAHQLVVVCAVPEHGRDAWRTEMRALGLREDEVVITGHVDDATLDALYRNTALFVFTSRYEGFGLPALEAAAAGAPVVTTDVSSLPEVIDHPLAQVPLDDVDALARRITDALIVPAVSDELRAASARAAQRHTWSSVAQRTIDAYRLAAPRATRRSHGARNDTRPRLAVLGPYPPSKSGIGAWSERLVNALGERARVDVFREGDPEVRGRPAPHSPRVLPINAFGRVIGGIEYDTPIYTIGNGYHHRHTLDAALRTPGIVWLHETRLAGLYLTRAGLFHPGVEPAPADIERARATMADDVVRLHAAGAHPLGDDEWWRTEAYDERGHSFLADVVASARAVVVSTEMAARAVQEIAPTGMPVHVLPLPFPELRASTHQDSPEATRWIVSLGWVDPIKQPDVLVRAFAHTHARHPDTRLAFVGELAPVTREQLDELTGELSVADAVTFTGFVTPNEYERWLARASVAVQLRAVSRGEASAALNDALAAGIATTTNIPTAIDLPDGVVARLGSEGAPLVDELAAVLDRWGSDDGERAAYATAAAAHASTWRFDDLANRVVEIVAASPRTRQ